MNIIERFESRKLLTEYEEKLIGMNYSGWDVFDGLNSRFFNKLPLYNSRKLRLLWIQFYKRSPINFRGITSVPKGRNPKGLALFIRGYINIYKTHNDSSYLEKAYHLADELILLRSKGKEYSCWGYNFPWEARAFYVPAFKPNMIVSSFVAQAFLDLYEIDSDPKWLRYAEDAALFIESELLLFKNDSEICFGYIPGENTRVHNANLMGASLYSRLYSITGKEKYKEDALRSVSYSVNRQNPDGSWDYGENSHHKWVDNFHTGYNLVAIHEYQKNTGDSSFSDVIEKGLTYHLKNHFTEEFIPKYFNNKIFPIDIHNFAQGIITFLTLNMPEKANVLLQQSIDLMYDKKQKHFYYQKNKFYTIKIPYIRWAQAWMFYAMSTYLKHNYEYEKN